MFTFHHIYDDGLFSAFLPFHTVQNAHTDERTHKTAYASIVLTVKVHTIGETSASLIGLLVLATSVCMYTVQSKDANITFTTSLTSENVGSADNKVVFNLI